MWGEDFTLGMPAPVDPKPLIPGRLDWLLAKVEEIVREGYAELRTPILVGAAMTAELVTRYRHHAPVETPLRVEARLVLEPGDAADPGRIRAGVLFDLDTLECSEHVIDPSHYQVRQRGWMPPGNDFDFIYWICDEIPVSKAGRYQLVVTSQGYYPKPVGEPYIGIGVVRESDRWDWVSNHMGFDLVFGVVMGLVLLIVGIVAAKDRWW